MVEAMGDAGGSERRAQCWMLGHAFFFLFLGRIDFTVRSVLLLLLICSLDTCDAVRVQVGEEEEEEQPRLVTPVCDMAVTLPIGLWPTLGLRGQTL